jgi:hypothetical protein
MCKEKQSSPTARFALVAILALVTALTTLVGYAAASTRPAAMRLVKIAPLTIVGNGFPVGAKVKVVATTRRARVVVTVTAGKTGAFSARFSPLFAVEPCHGSLVVSAATAEGIQAQLKRACRPPDLTP